MTRLFQVNRRAPGQSALRVLFWWTGVQTLVRLTLGVLYRLHREGEEHVPAEGGVIFVSNHQSFLDPPIIGTLVRDRPFRSLARSTLFRSVLGWTIRSLGAIPIDRGRNDTGAMKRLLAALEQGAAVLIFPEGSRTGDGTLGRFERGVWLLIKRGRSPVVPVAVEGAHDAWPRQRQYPRLGGRVAVKAGPPIPFADLEQLDPDEALELIRRRIEVMRLELRAQLRRATDDRFPPRGPADRPYWEAEMSGSVSAG